MKKFIVRAFNDRGDLNLTSINAGDQKEAYSFNSFDEAKQLYNKEVENLKETHELADEFDEQNGDYMIVAICEEEDGEFIQYAEMSETYKL